jgi:hypothetical protein
MRVYISRVAACLYKSLAYAKSVLTAAQVLARVLRVALCCLLCRAAPTAPTSYLRAGDVRDSS